MQRQQNPELSIIVPALNEAAELPRLFGTLAAQEDTTFELIICDGGSVDGTLRLAAVLATQCTYTVRIIQTPPGRGQQMNAGASIATGDIFLFLHADSRFPESKALFRALSALRDILADSATSTMAARFALRFRRSDCAPSLAYFYYEAKAHLNRADCIRGDQGIMLTRACFNQIGCFDVSLPFLEDVKFADMVVHRGAWMILPATISTSARRFETEGLCARQVVNAIIANNHIVGWREFFTAMPGLYRCHDNTGRLLLSPFLEGLRSLLAKQDLSWRLGFWRATGRHVAANIWQLFFFLDARRAFHSGKDVAEVEPRQLEFYQRYLEPFTRNLLMDIITAVAVWLWFRILLIKSR